MAICWEARIQQRRGCDHEAQLRLADAGGPHQLRHAATGHAPAQRRIQRLRLRSVGHGFKVQSLGFIMGMALKTFIPLYEPTTKHMMKSCMQDRNPPACSVSHSKCCASAPGTSGAPAGSVASTAMTRVCAARAAAHREAGGQVHALLAGSPVQLQCLEILHKIQVASGHILLQRLTHPFTPLGSVAVCLLCREKDQMHNIMGVVRLNAAGHGLFDLLVSSKCLRPCTWVHSMHPPGQDSSPTLLPSCPSIHLPAR